MQCFPLKLFIIIRFFGKSQSFSISFLFLVKILRLHFPFQFKLAVFMSYLIAGLSYKKKKKGSKFINIFNSPYFTY